MNGNDPIPPTHPAHPGPAHPGPADPGAGSGAVSARPRAPESRPAPESAARPHTRAGTGAGRAGAGSPGNVWLCVPGRGQDDPLWPIWASGLIEAFSHPGDWVVIRSVGAYPGLAGEVAAVIGAALAAGRRPLALLPTPAAAARTRACLPATTATPARDPAARSGTGARRLVAVSAPVVVGVGRRRPATEAGPAALVVVLAGPVAPGARGPRRRLSPRLLGGWARVLRPGGLLVVLSPPPLGGRRLRPTHVSVVSACQDAGLAYTQHVVLVHTPTHGERLGRPDSNRRPHAPFWPVHTDLHVFTQPGTAVGSAQIQPDPGYAGAPEGVDPFRHRDTPPTPGGDEPGPDESVGPGGSGVRPDPAPVPGRAA